MQVFQLPEFDDVPVERFRWCARTKPWGLAKDPELRKVRDAMQVLAPVDAPVTKDIHVLVEHGYGVAKHQHKEWTVILYVDPGDPVVPIVVDGKAFAPAPGDVVVIAPFTDHLVERSHSPTPRLSFAILVDQDFNQSEAVAL